MATPHTHALPRAAALRRVPPIPSTSPIPSTIPLVPSWRERLARFWSALRGRVAAPAAWDEVGAETLSGLSPHLLADIGAPESARLQAEHERALRRQRLLELEQGHRAYQDARW